MDSSKVRNLKHINTNNAKEVLSMKEKLAQPHIKITTNAQYNCELNRRVKQVNRVILDRVC